MLIFNELKNKSNIFYPAVLLEKIFPHKFRKTLRLVAFVLIIVSLIILIISSNLNNIVLETIIPKSIIMFLTNNLIRFRGFFIVALVVWLKTYLAEIFYLSYYFRIGEVDFEVAKLVFNADKEDMTGSFLRSPIGKFTMKKLGINTILAKEFLNNKERNKITDTDLRFYYNARKIETDDEKVVNLPDYLKSVFDKDDDFVKFLAKNNVNEEEFFGASEWVQSIQWKIRNKQRVWSRESLMRIPSAGRNWYIENTDYLNLYTHLIYENNIYRSLGNKWPIFRDEAEKLEALLLDQKLHNVMVISDNTSKGMQVVSAFGKMIVDGHCLPRFENKKMFVFNTASFVIHKKNSDELKENFMRMVNEIRMNSDVILVFSNLGNFFDKTMELDFDTTELLKEIMVSRNVQIIAVVSRADYFSQIEPDFNLVKHFDKLDIPNIDKDFVLRVLQDEALVIEKKDKQNIIFPVLNELAKKSLIEIDPIKSALKELHEIYE